MSDRCEKFVTMPPGSGYDDRCAVCGVPCEEHPSDKARCSHPSEDEKPIRFCHLHFGHYGPHEWAAPLSPIALDKAEKFVAYDRMPVEILAAEYARVGIALALWQPRTDGYPETGESYEKLQAREKAVFQAIRTAVARVAQEEREKYEGRLKAEQNKIRLPKWAKEMGFRLTCKRKDEPESLADYSDDYERFNRGTP